MCVPVCMCMCVRVCACMHTCMYRLVCVLRYICRHVCYITLCNLLQERDLERVNIISGDESKKAKIRSRIESLQGHRTEVQRQKQTVNEYLYSNNESVGRVQAEINRECEKIQGELGNLLCQVCGFDVIVLVTI